MAGAAEWDVLDGGGDDEEGASRRGGRDLESEFRPAVNVREAVHCLAGVVELSEADSGYGFVGSTAQEKVVAGSALEWEDVFEVEEGADP